MADIFFMPECIKDVHDNRQSNCSIRYRQPWEQLVNTVHVTIKAADLYIFMGEVYPWESLQPIRPFSNIIVHPCPKHHTLEL